MERARNGRWRHGTMELWGGIECTINRVHERFLDQHHWSAHREHVREDLERIASLGLRVMRTALHWEYYEASRSWAFFDRMLDDMRSLHLEPIAGLVHHGSGPVGTDLLDLQFPEKLAAYASKVATRYPWLTRYTPVNEPHTTSRFSCLYGHWYPHHRDMGSYVRALVNEVRATALSMSAIREVQPAAQLIYTEDGGSIFSSAQLESFRKEREERRWLGTDLLCGCVTLSHPLYGFLRKHGIAEAELDWFQANPCPPSVIGFNYYPTSDRFLDHRLHLYPENYPGGDSGSEPLVDIEAIRVYAPGIPGVGKVLREAWERYHIPVAITEAHLGGGCEDQIRWLTELWQDAASARNAGVDVVAVTVWALLGSWNWSNLCTVDAGVYEPGVFRIQDGVRHPTLLTEFVARLAAGEPAQAATDEVIPWWHRPDRILYSSPEA